MIFYNIFICFALFQYLILILCFYLMSKSDDEFAKFLKLIRYLIIGFVVFSFIVFCYALFMAATH